MILVIDRSISSLIALHGDLNHILISSFLFISRMTDWGCPIPKVSRLVCEDEVSGLAVNKRYIICQFWIQPEIAVFSRYNLELVR